MKKSQTSLRKQQHIKIALQKDVSYKSKTAGFENFEFKHNALPEIDASEVTTETKFLGKELRFPLIIGSMTGGYAEAKRINKYLAEICAEKKLALGVGSQRQALEDTQFHSSFSIVREVSHDIPVFGNIGATELLVPNAIDSILRLVELIKADGFAIHLNPLQEFLQPEGKTNFRGVLKALEKLVQLLPVPIIVKEIGAGISSSVATSLASIGVHYIDVAGAGGTSWAGIEILRTKFSSKRIQQSRINAFWDWGIPTVIALEEVATIKKMQGYSYRIIASGGIQSGIDMAKAFALGADYVSVARPILKILIENGKKELLQLLEQWEYEFRGVMFLTGSRTLEQLQHQHLYRKSK
ncbi:MAG: type 2 isopentenyl-diphosphate Delta-isomerase [Bacteroidetes bacterium]|nr:type 2 isopentenyl-diphosphate Delta-isomerase [Bacteroidota bacterium]